MKTCILVVCVLLLTSVGMSEKREQGRVEGKMYRDLHRMDRMDVKSRVRRNVCWLLHFLCL